MIYIRQHSSQIVMSKAELVNGTLIYFSSMRRSTLQKNYYLVRIILRRL